MKNIFVLLLLFLIMTLSLEANLRHLSTWPPKIINPLVNPFPCPKGTKMVFNGKEFECT